MKLRTINTHGILPHKSSSRMFVVFRYLILLPPVDSNRVLKKPRFPRHLSREMGYDSPDRSNCCVKNLLTHILLFQIERNEHRACKSHHISTCRAIQVFKQHFPRNLTRHSSRVRKLPAVRRQWFSFFYHRYAHDHWVIRLSSLRPMKL